MDAAEVVKKLTDLKRWRPQGRLQHRFYHQQTAEAETFERISDNSVIADLQRVLQEVGSAQRSGLIGLQI